MASGAQVVPDVLRRWVDDWMEFFIINEYFLAVSSHPSTQEDSTDTSSTPPLPWQLFRAGEEEESCFFTVEHVADMIMAIKKRRDPPVPPTMEVLQRAVGDFEASATQKQKQPRKKRVRTNSAGQEGAGVQEGADDQEGADGSDAPEMYNGVVWHVGNQKHEVQISAPGEWRDPTSIMKQVYLGSFDSPFMAAVFWDLVQIKLYLCGFRVPARARVQLNFTEPHMLQEYLLRLQQPEWVALTDWREVIQYVKREAQPGRSIVPRHLCGSLPHGVYIRGGCKTTADIPDRQSARTKYEAHVFDINSGRLGRYQVIPNRAMPSTTTPKIRRFQWATAEEAGRAYDREVIRLGLYSDKELNHPMTDYLPELQESRTYQRELDILYAWVTYKAEAA